MRPPTPASPASPPGAPDRALASSRGLALDGAPDRPNAPWSWRERALHVGSAVFGAGS